MNNLNKTLIIDDEKLARERLKRLLSKYDNVFQIIGEASNGDDAEKLIEELKPDIIFLDIEMPGKNVFQMLADIKHKPFVIFCTAYDKYALDAFNTYSIDYLLKPVEDERIKLTIEKINRIGVDSKNDKIFELLEDFKNFYNKPSAITSISHKVGNKIIPVKLEDIVYFDASDKYVNFYNVSEDKFITDFTLSVLCEKLPANFIRISKSVIINKAFVKEMHKYYRGRFVFIMNDKKQTKIISGGIYNSSVKECFEL